jgi:hypothetical protein
MPLAAVFGGVSAAASVGSSIYGAHQAGSAADAQVTAANHAADLQHQDTQAALAYQQQQDALNRSILSPYIATGTSANMTLGNLMGLQPNYQTTPSGQAYNPPAAPAGPDFSSMDFNSVIHSGNPDVSPDQRTTIAWGQQGIPMTYVTTSDGKSVAVRTDHGYGAQPAPQAAPEAQQQTMQMAPEGGPQSPDFGSLAKGFDEKFVAPTADDLNQDPGFESRIRLGNEAIERSAAARGSVLNPGTLKELMSYNSDQASQEYGATYNRRMQEYLNRANIFNQNNTNLFNRYSALSGGGQTTAANLGQLGNQSANQIANTYMTSGAQQGEDIMQAGNARASGYIGAGNAWQQGLGGMTNNLMDLYYLQKKFPSSGGSKVGSNYAGQFGGG